MLIKYDVASLEKPVFRNLNNFGEELVLGAPLTKVLRVSKDGLQQDNICKTLLIVFFFQYVD
jgi:hypothetical protein